MIGQCKPTGTLGIAQSVLPGLFTLMLRSRAKQLPDSAGEDQRDENRPVQSRSGAVQARLSWRRPPWEHRHR